MGSRSIRPLSFPVHNGWNSNVRLVFVRPCLPISPRVFLCTEILLEARTDARWRRVLETAYSPVSFPVHTRFRLGYYLDPSAQMRV